MIVAATYFRLSKLYYFPNFVLQSLRAAAVAARSPGNRTVRLHIDRHLTLWTLTAWDSEEEMHAYVRGGLHARLIPLAAKRTRTALVGHWLADEVPNWDQVHNHLAAVERGIGASAPTDNAGLNLELPLRRTMRRARHLAA